MIKPILLDKVFILVTPWGKNPILRQCGHIDTRFCSQEQPKDYLWFKLKCDPCESGRT